MNNGEKNRKTIVQNVHVNHWTRDSLGFPKVAFEGQEQPAEVWAVHFTVREGMLPEKSFFELFLTEEEANQKADAFPAGSEYEEVSRQWLKTQGEDFFRKIIDTGGMFLGAGDEDLYLPWKVLVDGGITAPNGVHVSQKVLDRLGQERIEGLKNRFGDNWEAAAEFEYCWLETHHSSAVCIAAECRYHYFISGNEFAAGYLLRDLEVLVHGVEKEASKAIQMRQNAGKAGSAQSSKSREARRSALVAAMEDVAARNPDIAKLGEAALTGLALNQSVKAEPKLWRQGKGQASEYVGEVRRGEAGGEMQARYRAIFGHKPPKQFP
ncbi:hypothetical protein [Nioella sediminis]|uniref:hypothetical protein n=1 Tax=Nioella sediminis TaxID=1912092 RepID=UPI000B12AC10|nr:hypothetical protein [Nioella sediminis]